MAKNVPTCKPGVAQVQGLQAGQALAPLWGQGALQCTAAGSVAASAEVTSVCCAEADERLLHCTQPAGCLVLDLEQSRATPV